MKEKIVKLINSGNKENIILGMHLLGNFTWKEILKIIDSHFPNITNIKENRLRYLYEKECTVITNFYYGDNSIYVGATNIVIGYTENMAFANKIIVK